MIYITTNTTDPTGYFRTTNARQTVRVARCWQQLGRLGAIDVMIGGDDRPLRTVRVPLGKTRETIAAIRAASARCRAALSQDPAALPDTTETRVAWTATNYRWHDCDAVAVCPASGAAIHYTPDGYWWRTTPGVRKPAMISAAEAAAAIRAASAS